MIVQKDFCVNTLWKRICEIGKRGGRDLSPFLVLQITPFINVLTYSSSILIFKKSLNLDNKVPSWKYCFLFSTLYPPFIYLPLYCSFEPLTCTRRLPDLFSIWICGPLQWILFLKVIGWRHNRLEKRQKKNYIHVYIQLVLTDIGKSQLYYTYVRLCV